MDSPADVATTARISGGAVAAGSSSSVNLVQVKYSVLSLLLLEVKNDEPTIVLTLCY